VSPWLWQALWAGRGDGQKRSYSEVLPAPATPAGGEGAVAGGSVTARMPLLFTTPLSARRASVGGDMVGRTGERVALARGPDGSKGFRLERKATRGVAA
jgi:hypothetical protein